MADEELRPVPSSGQQNSSVSNSVPDQSVFADSIPSYPPGHEDEEEARDRKRKDKKDKKHGGTSRGHSRSSSAAHAPPSENASPQPLQRVAGQTNAAGGPIFSSAAPPAGDDGEVKNRRGGGGGGKASALMAGAAAKLMGLARQQRSDNDNDGGEDGGGGKILNRRTGGAASSSNANDNDAAAALDDADGDNGDAPAMPLMNRRAAAAAKKREAELEAEKKAREKSEKKEKKARAKAAAEAAAAGGDAVPFLGDDGEEERRQKKRAERAERRKAAAANGGGGGGGSDGDDDGNRSVSSLGSFESFDPNDLDRLRRRLNKVTSHDPRIIYEPQIDRIPMWVHRWSDLKLFTDMRHRISSNPYDTVSAAVVRQLQKDLAAVDLFMREIAAGREGGFGEQSSAHYEEPDTISKLTERAVADLSLANAVEAMGQPNTAASRILAAAVTASPKALHKKPMPDVWKWPNAAYEHAKELRETILATLEEAQNAVQVGAHPTDGIEGTQYAPLPRANNSSIESILFRATMEELFAGDRVRHGFRGQKNLRVENAVSKIPIIHSEFLIDDDGPRMQADVLNFPDMLTPPVGREGGPSKVKRSITVNINYMRFHNHERFTAEHEAASEFLDAYERYRLLASNMTPGVKSRRFYEHLLRSIEHEDPPHPYLAVVQELHVKTCEMESSCLKAMLRAWQSICQIRVANGGHAGTHLEFALAKTGDTEATVFNERVDNILDFTPVVTDIDAVGSPLQAGQAYAVALHSQLSASQGSQLVGTTDKRGLNTLFTAVFKESFEMLTNHDPVRFTAVLLDHKGVVLATVDIPASLNHAQHLLEFKTQMQYTTPEGPRTVTGAISISTTWTTVAGMTIEDIERCFLKGEADPMDPRNDAMVRILGKYYIEQAAAARRADAAATAASNNKENVGRGAGGAIGRGGKFGDDLTKNNTNNRVAGLFDNKQTRLRATWDDFKPAELNDSEDKILNTETYKLTNMMPKMRLTERQQMLHRRWLISKGELLAADAAEAKLVNTVIPASDVHAARLMRDLRQAEKDKAREAEDMAAALVKKEGDGVGAWQQRIRNMKMTQAKKKKLRDHELQAQILILPPIPTFDKLLKNFFRWFVPRSPLNPEREDRLDIDVIRAQREQIVDDSRIIVHILKVSNLPGRDRAEDVNNGGGMEGAIQQGLEPFVVATFIGSEAQTRIESGVNPAFFESLELDFKPSDYEDSTLSLIDDDVCISFYDKVQVSLPPAVIPQSAAANVTHFRLERRLLGTVKIPFYSLYESETASLEGQFDISMPRVISGYNRPEETPSVHLYVSLYPAIAKVDEDEPTAEETLSRLFTQPMTRELYELYMSAIKWRSSCRSMVKSVLSSNPLAKKREIEPFVNNSKGDLTFVCRYLSADGIKPPPSVTDVGSAIRFVSLMPFVVDMIAWNDEKDVWSTLVEFMAMGAGDYEELAMMLVMFLRYLQPSEQTFLVLGTGKIFKQATFVLHTSGETVNIIDPRTGCIYNIENPRCGMEEVSMVVSHDQVWANVQLSGSPHRMVWNFSDRRYWVPMFTPQMQPMMANIPSIQRPSLEYPAVARNRALEMEEHVRREVKKALKAWRRDRQPNFQQRVGTIIREVLVEFERERCAFANIAQGKITDKHTRALGEFSAQYEAVGVPVNVGYKDDTLSELIEQLYETRVHELGTDNAVFGLGVFVKAYTNSVISIWVYLLGLVPKDPHGRL